MSDGVPPAHLCGHVGRGGPLEDRRPDAVARCFCSVRHLPRIKALLMRNVSVVKPVRRVRCALPAHFRA